MSDIEIREIEAIPVVFTQHVGPYNEVGQAYMKLFKWLGEVGVAPGRGITLSYDNPQEVPADALRSDACLEVQTDAEPPEGISLKTIPGGRFAVYTLKGSYDQMPDAYMKLFAWMAENGEEVGEMPCMDIYLNNPGNAKEEDLLTEICVPLKS